MLWIIVVSVFVTIGASMSLWATYTSHRQVATGRPRFEDVADLTGVWSRAALDQILGPRDSEDRYRITPEQIRQIPRPAWKTWLDSTPADVACIIAAIAAPSLYVSTPIPAIALLSASAIYVIGGYACAAYVTIRAGAWRERE